MVRAWTFFALLVSFAGCGGESTEPVAPPPAVFGKAPRATGGFPSVVMLSPDPPVESSPPPEPAVMDQFGREFSPRLLLARHGQPVEFRNSADEAHNVHVAAAETGMAVFNVVTPIGGGYTHTFELPGAYDVSCNMHPAMAAYVVVTETPYAAAADKNGEFSLADVPPGTYRVRVWNMNPDRRMETTLQVSGPGTELALVPES